MYQSITFYMLHRKDISPSKMHIGVAKNSNLQRPARNRIRNSAGLGNDGQCKLCNSLCMIADLHGRSTYYHIRVADGLNLEGGGARIIVLQRQSLYNQSYLSGTFDDLREFDINIYMRYMIREFLAQIGFSILYIPNFTPIFSYKR